jgi:hypothetical protein
MKILFDQGTPKPLKTYHTQHEVLTAYAAGWSNLSNGELLSAAQAAGFDLLITTDKNLAYQQNLSSRKIAIIVLPFSNWPQLERHHQMIEQAVAKASLGSYQALTLANF